MRIGEHRDYFSFFCISGILLLIVVIVFVIKYSFLN